MHPAIRSFRFTTFALALTLVTLPALAATPVAKVDLGYNTVTWSPQGEFAGLQLTVSGPAGTFQNDFGPGEAPQLDLSAMGSLVDGLYTWELRATPIVDDVKITAMSRTTDNAERGLQPRPGYLPDEESLVQSGSFRVKDGNIVQPAVETTVPSLVVDTAGGVSSAAAPLERATAADQIITDDLLVQMSLCVGFDCNNGLNFGFDTVILKENNLRMLFDDTSNSGSFPSNDWRLVANDTFNGGASYFAIQDATAGRDALVVQAGAKANNLVIENGGDVGINKSNPVVRLHMADGDSPTLRLEQDGSSGFTPQTWDLAGNEANFFVRDVTNGSKLPFRIKPGAPDDSVFIAANGDIGMGTDAPTVPLHVFDGSTPAAGRVMLTLENNGASRIELIDNDQNQTWRINNGGTQFSIQDRSDTGVTEFILNPAGDLTITGSLFTAGSMCGSGCDLVFEPQTSLASIEEHAEEMWQNKHLPAVGPTKENSTFNISHMTGGMLNELEMAHIYIEQLNNEIKQKDAEMASLQDRLARIESQLQIQ